MRTTERPDNPYHSRRPNYLFHHLSPFFPASISTVVHNAAAICVRSLLLCPLLVGGRRSGPVSERRCRPISDSESDPQQPVRTAGPDILSWGKSVRSRKSYGYLAVTFPPGRISVDAGNAYHRVWS